MDVTPLVAKNKKLITAYSKNYFSVNGEQIEGNILIYPDKLDILSSDITLDNLNADIITDLVTQSENDFLLLIGASENNILPLNLRMHLKAKNINTEIMKTSAAVRTYNILLTEDRNVAALLFLP